jgi:hypothetical protein
MQFRRYRGSRIFAFDMGRSMRATILGLGGEHYDLGADGGIAFQPSPASTARLPHLGRRMGRRPPAARRRDRRPGREGGHLVGAREALPVRRWSSAP